MSNVGSHHLVEIERAVSILAEKRSKLAVEKTTHQAELSRLNDRVRGSGGMPPLEYKSICRKQNEIKGRIRDIETAMAEIKSEIRSKEVLRSQLKADIGVGAITPEKSSAIRSLRDRYVAFAADPTRVSSMRQMAAQFAQELELIETN